MKIVIVEGNRYPVTEQEFERGWAQVGQYITGELQGLPIMWESEERKAWTRAYVEKRLA